MGFGRKQQRKYTTTSNWSGNCPAEEHGACHRCTIPTQHDFYTNICKTRASRIDVRHRGSHELFQLLYSWKNCLCNHKSNTQRHRTGWILVSTLWTCRLSTYRLYLYVEWRIHRHHVTGCETARLMMIDRPTKNELWSPLYTSTYFCVMMLNIISGLR